MSMATSNDSLNSKTAVCSTPCCGNTAQPVSFLSSSTAETGNWSCEKSAIARFSVAHHITGSAAWVAALVMMALADVLTRLAVIYLRGRRLAAAPAAPAARIPAGVNG